MLRIPRQAFARRMLAVVFVGTAALGGCTLDTDVSAPGGLLKVTSDPQAVAVNAVLANDLTVLVVNQFGERLKNVSVAWGIESGGGSISATSCCQMTADWHRSVIRQGPLPGRPSSVRQCVESQPSGSTS